ncbi:MAG: oligopeptide/dipeptide ABC transporter ATP-binding protein [Gaiellaceae bacterium]
MSALLEVRALVKEFPRRRREPPVRAVDGVDVALAPSEAYGLVGESGSGKTTIARCMLGLERPTGGTIVYDGVDLASRDRVVVRRARREMQLVFQQPTAALDPRMTVRQLVAEPLTTHGLARGDELRERVERLLTEVGLSPALLGRYPHELSGGQCQRVGIARSLSTEPRLLVLDEPTSALDVVVQAQILNLLLALRRERSLTFLLISHDLGVVGHLSDRIGVMYLGRLVEEGPGADVLARPLHPYTRALLGSRRGSGSASLDTPPPLRGEMPPQWAAPGGCRFHPRCPLRERLGRPSVCETDDPSLGGSGHRAACHFHEATE